MEVAAVWEQEMVFRGEASGLSLTMAPGDSAGFSPMELVLVGLAGCTAMDVVSILRKKRQRVTAFEVKVRGQRATEYPRVFTEIEVEYHVRGHGIQPAAVERAIALSTEKYCSVQAMLAKSVAIRSTFTISEEG